jgi:hypothetical protein
VNCNSSGEADCKAEKRFSVHTFEVHDSQRDASRGVELKSGAMGYFRGG